MEQKVIFNVLAKNLENAIEISKPDPKRILVGLMCKEFATNEEAVQAANTYKENGILISVGLGAGDPAMWKRVAEVSAKCLPYHINQVYPAAGYTKGVMEQVTSQPFIVNSLVEPADKPGMVYVTTGEKSQNKKEAISCEAAAKLMADIGLNSLKFYPIGGNKKLDHVKAMAEAAAKEGIEIFEPTGSITVENVHEIVQICLDAGAKMVIPHLYTSLVDKETGCTNPQYITHLLAMNW